MTTTPTEGPGGVLESELESGHAVGTDPKYAPQTVDLEEKRDLDISLEHREYILQRHGTLELSPFPSASAADPLNWPSWKVKIIISSFSRTSLTAS